MSSRKQEEKNAGSRGEAFFAAFATAALWIRVGNASPLRSWPRMAILFPAEILQEHRLGLPYRNCASWEQSAPDRR